MHTRIGEWRIRDWQDDDAPALARYLGNERVSMNLAARHPRPYTEEHAKAWISLCAMEADPVDFAIASDEEAVGGLSLSLQRGVRGKAAEIGYWVGEPYWGRGHRDAGSAFFRRVRVRALRAAARLGERVCGQPEIGPRTREVGVRLRRTPLRKSVVKDGRVLDELVYAFVR